jgi:hypothetical protein
MKPWVATRHVVLNLEPEAGDLPNSALRFVRPDHAALDLALGKLVTELNAEQWEVKAVVPLNGALASEGVAHAPVAPVQATAGGKQGPIPTTPIGQPWAAPVTHALFIVAQRTEWIEDDAYRGRMEAMNESLRQAEIERERERIRAHNQSVQTRLEALKSDLAAAHGAEIAQAGGGLFRKGSFSFGDQRFPSREEALQARDERVAELQIEIGALERQILPTP